MAITIYNTESKKKEEFKPLEEGKVKLYVCGPTVYDFLHIGNFRGPIFFNMVRNWFEYRGYDVHYVYNYTDVDDKIIKRANEEGVESKVISERYIEEFEKDFNRLMLTKHDDNPRVTEYLSEIVSIVQKLIDNGVAYEVDGEVFYSIDKFETYGRLSGKKIEDLQAGQRVEVDQRKQNPGDFVLWKPSKEGEPSWDSPWGKGRPGWHIECSAMIQTLLGESIDIHGGGIDLIFPHHENEIAQGEGATGKCYCRYWMHNNFINMKDEKMSKSLGNIIKGREFMDQYSPEVLKFLMLSTHYRALINVNEEKIFNCLSGLSRIYSAMLEAQEVMMNGVSGGTKVIKALDEAMAKAQKGIERAMDDDFNTADALSQIFEVVRTFNGLKLSKKLKDPQALFTAQTFLNWLTTNGKMMSLFNEDPEEVLKRLNEIALAEKKIDKAQVEELVAQRLAAREAKDWAKADEARDKLVELGIEVHDGNSGSTWSVKLH